MERILRHEFVHYAQRLAGMDLPPWLKEGAAEYYSLLDLAGKRARIGLPDRTPWEILKDELWPGVEEFFARPLDEEPPDYNPAVFYARAWAVAWVLLENGYGQVERYDEHSRRGLAPEAAFEAAFGRRWVNALSEAKARFAAGTMTARLLDWAPELLEAPRRLGPMSADEAVLALADLAMAAGRWEHADRLLAPLRKRPPDAAILAGLAHLSLKRGRMDEARAQFQRAVEMGAEDAEAWFELAMLERDRGAPRQRVLELLDGACLRNPGHAGARFLRAKQRGGPAALDDLRAAAQLRPERPDFWRELAAAEFAAGRRPEAREAALRALKAARTIEDAQQARGLLRIVEAPPPAPAHAKPAVSTPAGWAGPKSESRFEGILEHIDCSGAVLIFRVRSAARVVAVYASGPGRIVARGGERTPREFACGPHTPRPVIVEYNAGPDRPPGTDGELVAIEFR